MIELALVMLVVMARTGQSQLFWAGAGAKFTTQIVILNGVRRIVEKRSFHGGNGFEFFIELGGKIWVAVKKRSKTTEKKCVRMSGRRSFGLGLSIGQSANKNSESSISTKSQHLSTRHGQRAQLG